MLDSSRCAPPTAEPAGTRRIPHTLSTVEAATLARLIAPISTTTIDDGWRDDAAETDATERPPQMARAADARSRTDSAPPARGGEDTQARRPISIDAYRRSLTVCPACAARLTAGNLCIDCGEQWWRCRDLARVAQLPRGYLSGLIAIGWLPAVQTPSGAWLRQRDAERIVASFGNLPVLTSSTERARQRAVHHLVLVPAAESPDG